MGRRILLHQTRQDGCFILRIPRQLSSQPKDRRSRPCASRPTPSSPTTLLPRAHVTHSRRRNANLTHGTQRATTWQPSSQHAVNRTHPTLRTIRSSRLANPFSSTRITNPPVPALAAAAPSDAAILDLGTKHARTSSKNPWKTRMKELIPGEIALRVMHMIVAVALMNQDGRLRLRGRQLMMPWRRKSSRLEAAVY